MRILRGIKHNKLITTVAIIYIVLFAVMPKKGYLSVKNSMYYVIEMLEIMPVIFILTAILEAWVPKKVIIKGFGENSGIRGSVLSFALGSISAGPIYAAFPIGKMLLKKGASVMNLVIILSSWAVIKIPMLANEAKFLGIKFMSIRWLLTVISIIIMGFFVSAIVKKEAIPVTREHEKGEIKKIYIKEKYCIGCGLCERLLPEKFEMINKKARFKNTNINNKTIKKINEIIEKCPAKAISFE